MAFVQARERRKLGFLAVSYGGLNSLTPLRNQKKSRLYIANTNLTQRCYLKGEKHEWIFRRLRGISKQILKLE